MTHDRSADEIFRLRQEVIRLLRRIRSFGGAAEEEPLRACRIRLETALTASLIRGNSAQQQYNVLREALGAVRELFRQYSINMEETNDKHTSETDPRADHRHSQRPWY